MALPKGEAPWIVGSAVKVGLPSATAEQVVAVHRDALVLRGDGTYLFRVNTENKAERVAVKTGTSIGDWVQVTGDVHDGDRMIVRGAERLRASGHRASVISGGSAAESSALLRAALDLGVDAVVVAGGDGTAALAIQILAGGDVPLGIVGLGMLLLVAGAVLMRVRRRQQA